jgi:hypothetical protein
MTRFTTIMIIAVVKPLIHEENRNNDNDDSLWNWEKSISSVPKNFRTVSMPKSKKIEDWNVLPKQKPSWKRKRATKWNEIKKPPNYRISE